jgi:prepilin-type processing-associated H-X9-DG protein
MLGRRHWARQGALTLVELLVVISVIVLLMALLLPALGKAQKAARETKCRNNMAQIYKAARLYTTSYRDMLPNLFAGLPFGDHVERYRKSHCARSTVPEGTEVAAGLWLVYTCEYAKSEEAFYCPSIPGRRRYGGSENPTVDDLPKTVGYVYNYFPDTSPDGRPLLELPKGVRVEEATNNLNQPRHPRFCALLADDFLDSLEQPHRGRGGINCCFWDGSVQWVTLETMRIAWNSAVDEAEVFSDDKAGSLAVRDTWVLFSERRR